jgi:hypothetical protein
MFRDDHSKNPEAVTISLIYTFETATPDYFMTFVRVASSVLYNHLKKLNLAYPLSSSTLVFRN